jgi:hypothetical protein
VVEASSSVESDDEAQTAIVESNVRNPCMFALG